MARFKRTIPGHGAVAARKTSSVETADDTSSEASFEEEDTGAAIQLHMPNTDIAAVEKRQDSVIHARTKQAASIGTIGTLTPRPQRKDLRRSLETSR
jgi:hypothetical protein